MKSNWAIAALALGVAGGGLALAAPEPASAQDEASAMGASAIQALADRIAIEDLVVRYYAHLGGTDGGAFGDYYTEDGVFEVNGDVHRGREAIVGLYDSMGGGVAEGTTGLFHMVLSNPVIDVVGDTATASFLWTGVVNGDPEEPPTIREQGREYDLLVRVDGAWKIKKRVVIADSGLPASMLDTWERKPDYDILAD